MSAWFVLPLAVNDVPFAGGGGGIGGHIEWRPKMRIVEGQGHELPANVRPALGLPHPDGSDVHFDARIVEGHNPVGGSVGAVPVANRDQAKPNIIFQ